MLRKPVVDFSTNYYPNSVPEGSFQQKIFQLGKAFDCMELEARQEEDKLGGK